VAVKEGIMRNSFRAFALLLAACVVSPGLSTDVTWSYPFSELSAVWTPGGNWAVGATNLFDSECLIGPPSAIDSSVLYCTIPALPEGVRFLTLVLSDDYSMSGSCTGGWAYTLFLAKWSINGSFPVVFISDYGTTENPSTPGSYDTGDSRPIIYPLFAKAGDQVILVFKAYVEGHADAFTASGVWVLSNISLTGHGGLISLQPGSWGLVKSLFGRER